jgi:outer membrane protein assembly factor BamA
MRWLCCMLACLAAPAWADDPYSPDAPGVGREAGPPEPPPRYPVDASVLPSVTELEAEGAVIGEIRVNPQNIFDLADPREDKFLYRIANALHIVTRPRLIERILLFKRGDRVSARLLAESERLLRQTGLFHTVTIRPVAYENGQVIVEVLTKDTWTLDPGLSVSRTGGVNAGRIELEEKNALGSGISLGISRRTNVDRTENSFQFTDNHFITPWTKLDYTYHDASDGKSQSLSVQRPFFALDSRWSAGASGTQFDRIEPVYVSGMNVGEYRHRQNAAEVFYGLSEGLINGWTRRHTVGLMYEENKYDVVQDRSPPGPIPANLDLAVPFYRFQAIEDRFRTIVNMNRIGRTEDITTGMQLSGQIGRSLRVLGSSKEQWVYALNASDGYQPLGGNSLLLGGAGVSGRYAGSSEQQRWSANSRFFHWYEGGRALFAQATIDAIRNADVPNSLLLGGEEGLRGYPLRYQSGERRAILQVEGRQYTDWYPFRLIRVGGAAFFDAGRAWGGTNTNSANPGWLSDVGIGLRFVNDRSAFGNVLHIDLAFPLNRGDPNLRKWQFSVQTKVTL